MALFSNFCNICYKSGDGNLKDISEESMKHIKDIMITFIGHAEIIEHNKIYLCQLCCDEFKTFGKFREKCFSNLVSFRQTYFNMKSKLELEVEVDALAVKNTLKKFVEEKVLRGNSPGETNPSVSMSTECHKIVECSADFTKDDSVFHSEVINIKSERTECEFDDDWSEVSAINNFAECDINDGYGDNTVQIEFIKQEYEIQRNEHVNHDFKMPVVNNSEGIECTKQQSHMVQEKDSSKLETTENESSGGLHADFEFVNVSADIKSEEDVQVGMKLPGCSNKSTAAIRNTQTSGQDEGEHGYGRSPTSLHSGAHNELYPDAEVHTCAVCNKSFRTRSYLLRHERRHNGARPFKCTVCNKMFTASVSLIAHQRIHTGERPFKCNICNKTFTQSASLIAHERTHSGDRPYKCTVCNKTFRQLSNLQQHRRGHSGERPYKCSVCSKEFAQSSNLVTHERIHSDYKAHKCTVCNRAFKQFNDLTVHERTHTGARPYKCNVCSKEFTQSCNLTRHQRIHTGEKPYKCSVCNMAFTASSAFNVHKRVHTGEKPYECTVCSRTYSDLSNLNKHKRTHSDDMP